MKKIMSVTLAMLLAVLCVIPAFAASYECALTADKTKVKVGDTIKVNVDISAGSTGCNFKVLYDKNYVEVLKEGTSETNLMVTVINPDEIGRFGIASAKTTPADSGTLCTISFKVLKLGTKISLEIREFLDEQDNNHASQIKAPVLTISPSGTVSSNTKITPATTAPATTKASAPVTQAPATQNNQQNNSQNSSQQPAQSNQGAAAANGNAQTNANTTANSTPAVTTQVAAQTENTVPEIAANATEAVSENTDTLTVGATEKKSIIPLIVAIVAALASAAAIVYIILKKKKEEKETGI
ncbi:MAG: hypothetical protein IJK26_07710 [Clostridia bacterium]|nr:hypothetical protein [Clostridia bacterium]